MLLKATLEECDPAVAMQIRDGALVEGIVLRHVYQAIFDPSYDQRCVSRYLISLWMSHHAPSMELLSRIIPSGFFPFLKEPPVSGAELEEMDQLEIESIGQEREDIHEFDDDDRLSFLSDSTSPDEFSSRSVDETLIFDPDVVERSFHTRSVSVGEISDSSSVARLGGDPRRQSASFARSSISEPRASVSWISATVRESFHTQIENDHTKARMLQKLQSSATDATTKSKRSSSRESVRKQRDRVNEAPRVRKRDIAYGFIAGALSKSKSDKHSMRRANRSLKQTASHSMAPSRRQENFRLLFFMLGRDHEQVDLIWNRATREELRRALFLEIERFSKYQISHGNGKALWNYEDFHVHYASLAHEMVIGGCYVRILSNLVQEKHATFASDPSHEQIEDRFVVLSTEEVPVRDPKSVVAALYRRILRENIRAEYHNDLELTLLCIKSLAIVSASHASPTDATDFEEIDYLTTLMTDTVHTSILENLQQVVRSLCLYKPNARRVAMKESSIETIVKLLQMAHISDRKPKVVDSEKIWLLESLEGDVYGPFSMDELKQIRLDNSKDLTRFWVRRQEDRISQHPVRRSRFMENMQLRWEIGINGSLHPLQMAHDAINILLEAARSNSLLALPNATTSADFGDGGLFPVPRAKCSLWAYVRKILPLLLRYDNPQLCHKTAVLLEFLYSDQLSITRSRDEHATNRSSLFFWGLFFMAFVSDTPQFDEIAGLLQSTHLYQSGFGGSSALVGILPEAMIMRLSSVSAGEFSTVFCGQSDSPSVIWNRDMRARLRESCLAHLQDYITILEEDVTSEWKFCQMAPIAFQELENELWCGDVYIGKFCEDEAYVVRNPLEFMGHLARQWREEVGRSRATFEKTEAASFLGLPSDISAASLPAIREGFRQKAIELESELFSSLESGQRSVGVRYLFGYA